MRLEILVDGMLAVHAKHAVFAALAAVEGITGAEVELGRVELDIARAERELAAVESELREAIGALGFSVRSVRRLPRQLPLA